MRIGVVGGGVVGRATARCFMEHGEVRVYDVVNDRRTHDLPQVLACDLIFVCLPTPESPDGSCDLHFVDDFFKGVGGDQEHRLQHFVLRSTVPVGTTKSISQRHGIPNIVHSPEFLTARCAEVDAQVPARNIVGMPQANACFPRLVTLYQRRFQGVPIHFLTSDESEAVKIFLNSFFAVKVAYFNEARVLSDRLGLNWERLMQALMSDGRVAQSHTRVPGIDGLRGYGGACLPKDVASMAAMLGDEAFVTRAAIERNKRDRERVA